MFLNRVVQVVKVFQILGSEGAVGLVISPKQKMVAPPFFFWPRPPRSLPATQSLARTEARQATCTPETNEAYTSHTHKRLVSSSPFQISEAPSAWVNPVDFVPSRWEFQKRTSPEAAQKWPPACSRTERRRVRLSIFGANPARVGGQQLRGGGGGGDLGGGVLGYLSMGVAG